MDLPTEYLYGQYASMQKDGLKKDRLYKEIRTAMYKQLCNSIAEKVIFNEEPDVLGLSINFSVEVFVLSKLDLYELYKKIRLDIEKYNAINSIDI